MSAMSESELINQIILHIVLMKDCQQNGQIYM